MRTAEFVSPKQADKMCDIISDEILDTFLKQDPNSLCGIETMGGYGKVWVCGEVTSTANVSNDEIKEIVKNVSGVENVSVQLTNQPIEISNAIKSGYAGDQGIILGYACKETTTMMPFEYEFARELNKHIYQYYPYDGKTQVTINGDEATIVASFQNSKSNHLKELIIDFFKNQNITHNQKFNIGNIYCNPLGEWNLGGFDINIGLTGRKQVVDNYGPRIPIGGGSFSGKDSTKIDRSAAYMARKIAVDAIWKYDLLYAIVELSYVIGNKEPIQARIKGNDQGINLETGIKLYNVNGYDLSPSGIIDYLDLRNLNYSETSQWGHFGNKFKWQ